MVSQNHFKQLMRRAAHSADAVVPVVSFPSLQEGLLPMQGVYRQEWAKRITAVIVTKIEQGEVNVSKKEEVSLAMWKNTNHAEHVYACDSLLGLGGLWLRDYISEEKNIPEKYQN